MHFRTFLRVLNHFAPCAHQAQGETALKWLSVVIVGSQSSQTTLTTSRAALPSYSQQVWQTSLRRSSPWARL